jgi:hypothetical protein
MSFASRTLPHAAVQARASLAQTLPRLAEHGTTEGHVEALATALVTAVQAAPWLWAGPGDSYDAAAGACWDGCAEHEHEHAARPATRCMQRWRGTSGECFRCLT